MKSEIRNPKSESAPAFLRAICEKCQGEFEYEPCRTSLGRPIKRHICDDCRAGRARWSKKKWKLMVRAPIRNRKAGERTFSKENMSRLKIGQLLGLDHSTVESIERGALHKIRNSPELQRIYEQYKEAGLPSLSELMERMKKRAGDLLMEYQMQVADFWTIYERCPSRARRKILDDIRKCQQMIAHELGKIKL